MSKPSETSSGASGASSGGSPEGRSAGRGVLYIAAAKFYFMVAGAAIELRLPAILATTVFGAYKVVGSLVSPINNVLVTGTIQATSRFTAQDPTRAREIQRAALRMHLFIGLPIALAFAAMAPLFALFFHDASKTGPIMLAAGIVAGYSFYAVLVGRANGEKRFGVQAGLDMGFATLRAAFILGLAMAGLGLYGAIGGWVAAVAAILVVAAIAVGLPGRRDRDTTEAQAMRPLMSFFGSVAAYLVLTNFIMVVDQLLLKRLVTEWFFEHAAETKVFVESVTPGWIADSLGPLEASRAADAQVGYYAAVQNLARLSYQAILAATFVIFPLVSRTTFVADREATTRYVQTTLRYATIFASALAVVFAANPTELLDIPYPSAYAIAGGPALMALALGNVAFSVFAICGTILNGAGHTRAAIRTAAITLVIAVAANAVVIPLFDPGRELLLACALATATAMTVGAAISAWYAQALLGASLPVTTALRIAIAAGVTVAVGRSITTAGAGPVLAESALCGVVFLVALFFTRELTRADLGMVLGVVSKRRSS